MGFHISLVSINNLNARVDDKEILKVIGFEDVVFVEEITFENAFFEDNEIAIGYYNNSTIILDGYKLAGKIHDKSRLNAMALYEKSLSDKFSNSEILTIACSSVNNYHMYSLVKDKKKVRAKMIADGYEPLEFGEYFEEEIEIYKDSKIVDDRRLFKSVFDSEYVCTEAELMEDFTFGVAKRHLGITISSGDDEEFSFNLLFKKYLIRDKKEDTISNQKIKKSKKSKRDNSEVIEGIKKRINDLIDNPNDNVDGFLIFQDIKNAYKALHLMEYREFFEDNEFNSKNAYYEEFTSDYILTQVAKCCVFFEQKREMFSSDFIKFTAIVWSRNDSYNKDEIMAYIINLRNNYREQSKPWWKFF